MFSRQNNYSSLGGDTMMTTASSTSINNSNVTVGGRRAFRDVTNAARKNGFGGKSSRSLMHAGNDKQNKSFLPNKQPKIQVVLDPQSSSTSRPFGNILQEVDSQTIDQRSILSTTSTTTTNQQPQPHISNLMTKSTSSSSNGVSTGSVIMSGSSYQFTGKVDDIDAKFVEDPLAVTEYVQDMMTHFRQQEKVYATAPTFIESRQSQLTDRMRGILIDWLMEVHMKFKLLPDTLHLTVALLDRYLACRECPRSKLQLVGVCCLFLATKYEEIYPPGIEELVYICDNAYTKAQMIKMETQILGTLGYKITQPTAHTFLLRYSKAAHANRETMQLSQYLMDSTLMSYPMLKYLPSQHAAAALMLARHALGRHPWSPTLLKYTEYLEDDIVPVARAMIQEKSSLPSELMAVHKKYSSHRYGGVANKNYTFKGF